MKSIFRVLIPTSLPFVLILFCLAQEMRFPKLKENFVLLCKSRQEFTIQDKYSCPLAKNSEVYKAK